MIQHIDVLAGAKVGNENSDEYNINGLENPCGCEDIVIPPETVVPQGFAIDSQSPEDAG
jgi:hypothetical protein